MTSWSNAVVSLASLASKGDRDGCLSIIPTLLSDEINTIIDPVNKLTFLHRACQLQELSIITSLLEHGADLSLLNSNGESCWSLAASNGSLSILTALAPYVRPNLPQALVSLIGSKLSESEILSLLHILFQDQSFQSEWVDSHAEAVHLCAFLDRYQIFKYLLQYGFEQSLRLPDSYGLSPLQIIERRLIWFCLTEQQKVGVR
jgi:ankyrin repeat protein